MTQGKLFLILVLLREKIYLLSHASLSHLYNLQFDYNLGTIQGLKCKIIKSREAVLTGSPENPILLKLQIT